MSPLKLVGVLSPKGANMVGIDQDDILIAPWTAIKYRVAGSSLANVNQSAQGSQSSSGSDTSQKVNTLNQIYPSSQQKLYPEQSATQQADTPLPVRFTNVDTFRLPPNPPRIFPSPLSRLPSFSGNVIKLNPLSRKILTSAT